MHILKMPGTPVREVAAGMLFLWLHCCMPVSLQSQTRQLPAVFSDLLARAHLTFDRPETLTETPCVENKQMNYEYALKYPDQNFEVRYAIRPMDSLLLEYEFDKKKGADLIHPNKWSASAFQATLLNIGLGGPASGQPPEIAYFDQDAVREEFHADWGALAFVQLGQEFGGTIYQYCLAVIIHKDFVGDAYFFYVSDRKDNMSELMNVAFHSLKFKD